MSMKASLHSGRNGSAKHNDRSFLTGKTSAEKAEIAPHINLDMTEQNSSFVAIGSKNNIEQAELHAYKNMFHKSLEATNKRYIAQGHKERCRTIEDLYKAPQTRPEEVILQVGNATRHISANELKSCYVDYINRLGRWNAEHGKPMRLLSAVLHADETTPHVHVRRVWVYTDKDGNKRIGQGKALEAAGIPLPHPDRPAGRYNNRKMEFDRMARALWIQTCRDHGIEIDDLPVHGVRHKDKQEFLTSEISKLQTELDKYRHLEEQYPEDFKHMRQRERRKTSFER